MQTINVNKKKVLVVTPTITTVSQVYLPSIYYILKTAYDTEGRYPGNIDWAVPYFIDYNKDSIWQSIVDVQPDIVCLSLYTWNNTIQHWLAEKIHKEQPQTIVIAGGPDIEWKHPEQYWQKHPYYHYMIYGDGESAFVDIIDLILENKISTLSLLNVKNLIFTDKKGKVHRTTHEIYRGKSYTAISHWLHCKDEFIRDCETIKKQNLRPCVAWESDKGCPYNCSFCDWESGLHHKVIRKTYDPTDEIMLFAECGCYIFHSNANFGFYDQDEKIITLIWTLIASGAYPGFGSNEPAWSKLNKKKVYDIHRRMAEIFGYVEMKVALQTITPLVLENIDRPSISWPEHKQMLLDFRKEFKTDFYPEVIIGLPGETRDSWDKMMLEFLGVAPVTDINAYHWHLLKNSPAAELDYMKQFEIEVWKSILPVEDAHTYTKINFNQLTPKKVMEFMLNVDNRISYTGELVWNTISHKPADLIYMHLSQNIMLYLGKNNKSSALLQKQYNTLRPYISARAEKDAVIFLELYKEYGSMPLYFIINDRLYHPSMIGDDLLQGKIKLQDILEIN